MTLRLADVIGTVKFELSLKGDLKPLCKYRVNPTLQEIRTEMAQPGFGKRDAKPIELTTDKAIKVHADYVRKASPPGRKPKKRPALAERIVTWLSFYTLVFVTIAALAPDAAISVIRGLNQLAAGLV